MKNLILLSVLLLSTLCVFAQTQIGSNIYGESAGDYSGSTVSLSSDGNILAIGASENDNVNGNNSGHVRVYKNVSGNWVQVGSDIDGEAEENRSGSSVSLSSDGSIVAIGAYDNNNVNGYNSGHVRVYKNESDNWIQVGSDIDGETAYDYSGISVSLSSDGNILAIGAPYNGGNGIQSGHVRVYKNVSGNWVKVGSDIDGEGAGDYSGWCVSLGSDGSVLAIGAFYNGGNGIQSGHVRVYKNESDNWIQVGSDIDGEAANDYSGYSVSLSSNGSVVAIGAFGNDGNGSNSGHVRVYKNESGSWVQVGNDIDGEAANDYSGYSVSLCSNGSVVAIGAFDNDGNGSNSGHVRVYKNVSGSWVQAGSDIDGEVAEDRSGFSVSLSSDGSVVAIGAPNNDGNGSNSGNVRVFSTGIVAAPSVPVLPLVSIISFLVIGIMGVFKIKFF
ncbi:MAG: hypothetical protein JXR50_06045 [Prolixibacteraceae bacterium]|nr:hypothetical protein [Prolixibacteraceae bacterium]MBN2649289.1 hypothetical protein [Prolixibacteraceae bacterium]